MLHEWLERLAKQLWQCLTLFELSFDRSAMIKWPQQSQTALLEHVLTLAGRTLSWPFPRVRIFRSKAPSLHLSTTLWGHGTSVQHVFAALVANAPGVHQLTVGFDLVFLSSANYPLHSPKVGLDSAKVGLCSTSSRCGGVARSSGRT